MKIVNIGPVYPYRGGIAHYTASLSRTLSNKHEVRIISFRSQYPSWLYPGSSDKDPSNKKHEVTAEFMLSPFNPLAWKRTRRVIQDWNPDIVIIQWWVTFWSLAYASIASLMRRINIPVIFLIHNVLPHETHCWDKPLARIGLRKGNAFIVHTETTQNKLRLLLPDAKISLCPLPLFNFIEPGEISKEDARCELGLPEQVPVLLFFGIIRSYKGLDHLIEALSILRNVNQEIYLVVAGEIWEGKRRYHKMITDLKLADNLCLIDQYIPNEELPLYFSAADIFVAPYIGGTASAALSLALNFGIPSIATEHIASGIYIPEHAHLSICEAGNSKDLADKITLLLNKSRITPTPPFSARSSWENVEETILNAWRNSIGT